MARLEVRDALEHWGGFGAVARPVYRRLVLKPPHQKPITACPIGYSSILSDLLWWQWRRRFLERYVCARLKFPSHSCGFAFKWAFRTHLKPNGPGLPGKRVQTLDLVLQPVVKPA